MIWVRVDSIYWVTRWLRVLQYSHLAILNPLGFAKKKKGIGASGNCRFWRSFRSKPPPVGFENPRLCGFMHWSIFSAICIDTYYYQCEIVSYTNPLWGPLKSIAGKSSQICRFLTHYQTCLSANPLKAQAIWTIKNHLCKRSPFWQVPQAYFNGHHSPALLIKDHYPFI